MFILDKQFYKPNIYSSASVETFSLVSGSSAVANGAKMLGFVASNASGTNGWVQVFDGYAQPNSGAAPKAVLQIASGSQASFDCGVFHFLPVSQGIVLVLSSTLATYTPISSGLWVCAGWIDG